MKPYVTSTFWFKSARALRAVSLQDEDMQASYLTHGSVPLSEGQLIGSVSTEITLDRDLEV
jgi:hypothetical protein